MNKILYAIAVLLHKIDNLVYRLFGYKTNARKKHYEKTASVIQNKLDIEHDKRDYYNRIYNDNHTTKQALCFLNKVNLSD